MADPVHDDGNASDDNTIIYSQRSSLPSVNARQRDEEIMPRALFLDIRHNNHHLDLDSIFTHRIILEIIRGHPIAQALTRFELVPLIYLQQFWHTLKLHPTAQPPRFTAKIDHFDVRITLRGIRRALDLPYVDNFDDPATEERLFEDIRSLGYQDPNLAVLSSSSQFRPKHLPPVWYTLCTILNRCMTSKHTGTDKANLSTLRMFHAFAFNLHIDYAILIWNEMIELVADQARPAKRRNFVPFQRFFQILIFQAMEDTPDIPRREEAERGPSQYMHRINLPNAPFAHIAVIPEDVLNYADQENWVVIQYREQNALMVQPDPAEPAQDANLIGSEGPNVEGVQEQRVVPEQREVRQTIRKRVGEGRLISGQASRSRRPRDPTPPRAEEEDPIIPLVPFIDDNNDDDDLPEAQLIPRRSAKRPRVESTVAESSQHIEHLEITGEAAVSAQINEEVEVDVESIDRGEARGRKEMSETVIESDKVLTTDSPQADPSRVTTSTADVRLSPPRIETDMVRPTMHCTPPPSHSSVSQQAGVSFSTGEYAHTLSAAHSVLAGIEAGRLQPRPPPFIQSTSSLAPFGTTSVPRSPFTAQHQVGSFRAPTGTPRVSPPFVGASQGPGGSPVIANTMPAMSTGHTVSVTGMSTMAISGLGVTQGDFDRSRKLIGPAPNFFVPLMLLNCSLHSINKSINTHEASLKEAMNAHDASLKEAMKAHEAKMNEAREAHESAMKEELRKLSENFNKAIKEKVLAESSTATQSAPKSEDELKAELLQCLLSKTDQNNTENTDLITLLRQQTQPPTPTPAPSHVEAQLDRLQSSVQDMTKAILAGYDTLAKRVTVLEHRCGDQAEASQRKRHDDPDDPDQHEGEKSTGDVRTDVGTSGGNVVETVTDTSHDTTTEGKKGKGVSDSDLIAFEELNVLADVIAGVEKPSASDNRTVTDWPIDLVHIDADEEPEQTTVQLKQAIDEVFDMTGTDMADPDSDTEAPESSTQTAGTSVPTASAPVIQQDAPIIIIQQAAGQLRDSKLEAELRHLQEIIQDEPGYVATGLRVRIMSPYQESLRRNMFVRNMQNISWEKVYGIEDWPQIRRTEYLYFMKNECLNTSVVRSDKPILKVLKVESKKLSRVWFPEFTVQRSDGSVHTFSEADFKSLKLEDVCNLYEILSRASKKGDWSDAYQSMKRFMKNILKFSYLKDFQMALEARQERVNIRPPNRHLPDPEGIHAYTVLTKPELGVVYPDANGKKKFLRIIEANKFCDGTFKLIQIHLESRLRMDEEANVKMSDEEKAPIKEVLKAIKYRKDYRNALRRFELTFGIRKTHVDPVHF